MMQLSVLHICMIEEKNLTLDVLEVINNSIISTYEKASNKGECTHMNENKAFTLKQIGEEEYKCLKCGKIMHEDELSDLPAIIKLEEDLHNNPPFSAYSRMTNHAIPGMSGPIPYSVYQQQNPNIEYKQPIPSYQVPYLYGKDYDDDKGE